MTNESKYTRNNLATIVKESHSVLECLKKLEIYKSGSNTYREFYRYVKYYGLNISHFTGQKTKGRFSSKKRPLIDYLNNTFKIESSRLKQRLFAEKLLEKKCSICKNTKWMGKVIPLQLDHIDGNHFNNNLNNLRILCANCHGQTENYCGRNTTRHKEKRASGLSKGKPVKCLKCQNPCARGTKSGFCGTCSHKQRRKFEIEKEVLEKLVKEQSMVQIGRMYGVTDNAIRKRCMLLGIKY